MAFLFPAPGELEFLALAPDARGMTIHVRAKRRAVPCPDCGQRSERVHSRYVRTLADLPWHGTPVRLRVQTRRFFCPVETCGRRIFAERLPGTAERYARHTLRLAASVREIALTLGGEPAARLSAFLGVRTSPDTLLRRTRQGAPAGSAGAPRVLGVDEWAYRKGRSYGTILVDLERSRVVDLLPDRSADSFAAWLEGHPGVEIITRDRSGIYSEGARRGAPRAVHVADRWHLVRNLTDAVEATLRRCTLPPRIVAGTGSSPDAPADLPAPATPPRVVRAKAERREQRLARYREVVALRRRGLPRRAIAAAVGLDVRTVRRWLAAGSFPERKERLPTGSKLDPHLPYLEQRLRDGCWNASQLWRELRTRGFAGGLTLVKDEVRRRRCGGAPAPTSPPALRRRSSRKTAWLLTRHDDELTPDDRAYVEAVTAHSADMRLVRALASEFRRMLGERDVKALGPWIGAARQSLLRRFAQGIHADVRAVRAAIELPWSNGPVEGQVNRLKMIKRQMYGRANFDLLRARVLHAA